MIGGILLICVILLCLCLAVWGIRQIGQPGPTSPLAAIPVQPILFVIAIAVAIYFIWQVASTHF